MEEDFVPFSIETVPGADDEEQESQAPALVTNTPAPWIDFLVSNNDHTVPPFVRMHNEILTFCEYIAPSTIELRLRESVLAEITGVITSLWPTSKVHVFGSQLTRILTPRSDLDIAVMDVPEGAGDHPKEAFLKLAKQFRDHPDQIVSYVEAITQASVPIVKLDHKSSGLAVDICINNDSGLTTGTLIRNYVREYPPLRPLTLVLKVFLSQRRLNETYTGGIGSFLLTLMIVSMLQSKQRMLHAASITSADTNIGAPQNKKNNTSSNNKGSGSSSSSSRRNSSSSKTGSSSGAEGDNDVTSSSSSTNTSTTSSACWNLGALLMEFFYLYGYSFNYHITGISLADGGKYLNKRKLGGANSNNFNQRPSWLYVQNPENPELDVGRPSYMMPKIRRAFEHAHQVLSAALVNRQVPSYLAYVLRTDDPTLQDRPGLDLAAPRTNADALK